MEQLIAECHSRMEAPSASLRCIYKVRPRLVCISLVWLCVSVFLSCAAGLCVCEKL